ncbi:hypothetical protein [Fervidobacterium sp.]
MIKVILNGEEKNFSAQEFENFGELLKSVVTEGQVLKTLRINDKEIPVSFIDDLRSAKLDEELLIEIETQDAISFLKDTLRDVLGYIKNVKELLPQVASNVITGNEAGWKAIKDLSEGLSAMENLRNSTNQITRLNESELALSAERQAVAEILRELLDALDRRDTFEISDLVENNIPVVLDYYIEYFSKVLESIDKVN